jgi:hypothetical protein
MHEPAKLTPDGSPRASGLEGRVSVRYRCDGPAQCHLCTSQHFESRWALVRNVSTTGVGLRLSGALSPGGELVVEFTQASALCRRALSAHVVHSTAQEDGTWLVGCRFVAPLNEEDLRALLQRSDPPVAVPPETAAEEGTA